MQTTVCVKEKEESKIRDKAESCESRAVLHHLLSCLSFFHFLFCFCYQNHIKLLLYQAACIWLLTLVKECSRHAAVQSRLLEIQRGFMQLLSESDGMHLIIIIFLIQCLGGENVLWYFNINFCLSGCEVTMFILCFYTYMSRLSCVLQTYLGEQCMYICYLFLLSLRVFRSFKYRLTCDISLST